MSVEHYVCKEDPHSRSCSEDEKQERGGPDEEHEESYSSEFHSLSNETSASRTERRRSRTGSKEASAQSCSGPSSESEEDSTAVPRLQNPPAMHRQLIRKRPTGRSRGERRQNRIRRASLLPPLSPDIPQQRLASAQEQRIKQLCSQVRHLQQQLCASSQENRLLRRLHSRHTVALQHFQDSQASLPQMIQKHSSEVHALQEHLRSSRLQNSVLVHRLRASETQLLHTCDTLRRLQHLSQDQSLEEREKLTLRLSMLSTDLHSKNKRIQSLEKNLMLSGAYFNRQLSAEKRKTMEAQELVRSLEEQISHLTQKYREKEKELEIHNIYSHRFRRHSLKRGTSKHVLSSEKENRTKKSISVQTKSVALLAVEGPARPLEIEFPQEECPPEGPESHSWEFYTEPIYSGSKEEGMKMDREEKDEETKAPNDHDCSGPKLEHKPQQEEVMAKPFLASPSGRPRSAEDHHQLNFQNLVITPSPSTKLSSSPGKVQRHYTFKEPTQNLHHGMPAYRYCRPQNSPTLLDTGAYDPSLLPAAARPGCSQPPNTKKSILMMELFGQAHMEQMPNFTGSERREQDSTAICHSNTEPN